MSSAVNPPAADGTFAAHLVGLLDETWHGAPLPGWPAGWSYYSDEATGFEQTLAGLSAEQAARALGGTSIAQHVQHTAFGARTFAAWLRGEQPNADWGASWRLPQLDAATWDAQRQELWSALAELRTALEQHTTEDDKQVKCACGAVAHLVYHLGAVRAKLKML